MVGGAAGGAEEKNSVATSQGVDSIEKIKNIYHLQIQKHPLPTKERPLASVHLLFRKHVFTFKCLWFNKHPVADGYPFLHKQTSKEDSKAVFLHSLPGRSQKVKVLCCPGNS